MRIGVWRSCARASNASSRKHAQDNSPAAPAARTISLMANPDKLPAPVIARQFGVGKLTRHLLVCVGPDCVDPAVGEKTWEHIKRRMKELNITGPDGPCYRTKCQCLRICNEGPIAVV